MRIATIVARVLLGLPFSFFGFNTILWSVFEKPILPPPEKLPDAAARVMAAFDEMQFMHPLRGLIECLAGLMILLGLWTPLGLVILAPVMVHIVLYHHFVDPNGLVLTYVFLALHLFLVYAYMPVFGALKESRAKCRW